MDARDLTIAALAQDLADAEAMAIEYRELLQLALEQLAVATRTIDRRRQYIARLCDERRQQKADAA